MPPPNPPPAVILVLLCQHSFISTLALHFAYQQAARLPPDSTREVLLICQRAQLECALPLLPHGTDRMAPPLKHIKLK